MLDMGQPVRILHLAEKLIALSGKTPYEDVDIVFTGLRPGEKMYEELFNDHEELRPTLHPRIRAAVSVPVGKTVIEAHLELVQRLIRARDEQGLLAEFKNLVPGYHCPARSDSGLRSCRSAADGRPSEPRRNRKATPALFPSEPVTEPN